MLRNLARTTTNYTKNIARTMTSSATTNASAGTASARRAMDTMKSHLSDPTPAPKLSPMEEYAWRAPSEGMQSFHDSFTWEFDHAYEHAEDLDGRPLASFLRGCFSLVRRLGMHHSIEERSVFPLLAHKHPAFAKHAEHEESHQKIHDGLEAYEDFLQYSIQHPETYTAEKLRAVLDSFRAPLFEHLDQEVEDLRPENLRKHGFTLAEIRRLPF